MSEFSLLQSFHIDTEGYTDRDREMFICGYEFATIYETMKKKSSEEVGMMIHRDNESRVRMMAGKMGRIAEIVPCNTIQDPDGTWSYLVIKGW